MRINLRFLCFLFSVLFLCFTFVGCATEPPKQPLDSDVNHTDDGPVSADDSQTADDSTSDDVTSDSETTPPETADTSEDTTEVEETTGEDSPQISVPAYLNPLTGLPMDEDFSALRPAAIMINNIQISCPQPGIASADVIYECLVEGGFTRLMALSTDYKNLPAIGSVRSARHYYLAMAQDYDALFVHIGGSTYAFDTIDDKKIQNLNGIEWLPSVYWQDKTRLQTMGYEHSWLTNGQGIVSGVKYKRYRTALKQGTDYPLDFVPYGTLTAFEDEAKHVHIPYSVVQTSDFVYDEATGKYLRYQFDGKKHIDGTTGEQLAFDNLIVYFCKTGRIPRDELNRIDMETNGTGTGYYITRGTYIPITWEKESFESPIHFYTADGSPLLMNAGKTFISVCPTDLKVSIDLNYEW